MLDACIHVKLGVHGQPASRKAPNSIQRAAKPSLGVCSFARPRTVTVHSKVDATKTQPLWYSVDTRGLHALSGRLAA